MRRFGLTLLLLVFVLPLYGRNPPKTKPNDPKPPVWDTRGIEEVDLSPAVHDGVSYTPTFRTGMSGALFPPPPAGKKQNASTTAVSPFLTGPRLGRVGVTAVPFFMESLYTANASNEADTANEASILSVNRSGVDYTVLSYQQVPAGGYYSVRFASATNLTSSGTAFTAGSVVMPAGYSDGFDSTLAANPYADGVRPGAIYLTACLGFRTSPNVGIANPMQVRTWASDNGGLTWTGGQLVIQNFATDNFIIDKPVTDVSWFSGSRGYLYVVWVEFPNSGNANRIRLRRNINGLWQRCRPYGGVCDTAWDAPINVNDGTFNDGAAVPQVVVNPDNGNVYVLWMNNAGAIQMRRSTDYGVTFQPPVNQAPITVVNGVNLIVGNQGYLPNGMRGGVVPTAEWNTAAHNLMLVWHTRTAAQPTDQTALYYLSFNPDTIANPLAVPAPFNDAANSQLQPALDNDDAGRALVTYLSTQANNAMFQLYGIVLSPAGGVLLGPTLLDNGSYTNGFAGDYHEVWYWNFADALLSRWNSSWSRNQGSWDNVVTGVR